MPTEHPIPLHTASPFDFDAAVHVPFRMQPGLRRLQPACRQLSALRPGSRHLHEKLEVLRRHPRRALQCIDGFDARVALHALAQQAAQEHPHSFAWDGRTAAARALGWAVADEAVLPIDDRSAPPLAEVGECLRELPAPWRLGALLLLAFAEDFAILDARNASIPWLAVALPSRWDPQAKVGRHFAEVHAPVADSRQLLAAADALARLVSGPQRWERFVWSITPDERLDTHPDHEPHPSWPDGDATHIAQHAWWRTERQTFIPVPGRDQALFTILVHTEALAEAIDSRHKAARLHASLASMSPQVLRYRRLVAVQQPLLQWLQRRAAAG